MSSLVVEQRVKSDKKLGIWLGFLAILCFSATLPATRLGVAYIDPTLFGLGRSLAALLPALMTLYWLDLPPPNRQQLKWILIITLTVVIGFPWLTAFAMKSVTGGQAGIVVAVLPLFTAIAGALMTHQRPSFGFWISALLGSLLVMWSLWDGELGGLQRGDMILLLASLICAIGYAAGGKLAKEMGGVAVICWAVVAATPFSLLMVVPLLAEQNLQLPWQAWASFSYVSVVSQWLAFMFWYRGLALGGVVRVSQIQLLQPFFTLGLAAWLLNEVISNVMVGFALAVVFTVAMGQKTAILEPANRLKRASSAPK